MECIAKAKKNGVRFGAKVKLTEAMVAQMKTERNAGVLIKDLVLNTGYLKQVFTGFWRLE